MSVKPGDDVFFIHTGRQRASSCRKPTCPVTEVAEPMKLDKGIAIAVTEQTEDINVLNDKISTINTRLRLCIVNQCKAISGIFIINKYIYNPLLIDVLVVYGVVLA